MYVGDKIYSLVLSLTMVVIGDTRPGYKQTYRLTVSKKI